MPLKKIPRIDDIKPSKKANIMNLLDHINKVEMWRVDAVKELEDELQGCYENGLEDDDYAVVLLKELLESLK